MPLSSKSHRIQAHVQRQIARALNEWYRAVFPSIRFLKKGDPEVDWEEEKRKFLILLMMAMLWASEVLELEEEFAQTGLDAQRILDEYELEAGRRLADIANTTQRQTMQAIAATTNSQDLIRSVSRWFSETRANNIASTELGMLLSAETKLAMRTLGSYRWIWRHGAICKTGPCFAICAANVGFTFDVNTQMPPMASHVNCLLPGNEVAVAGLVAAAQSLYIGRAVEITLVNGRKLSVTKNHPVLTPRGWVAAEFLREGDNVIVACDAQGMMKRVDPDKEHVPTAIEQVFSSFEKAHPMDTVAVPPSPEDLHGEGRCVDGDIKVVYAHRPLLGDRKSQRTESIREQAFDKSGLGFGPFTRLRTACELVPSNMAPLGGGMSSAGEGLTLGNSGLGHAQKVGGGVSSYGGIVGNELSAEDSSRDAYLASQFILRFASQIAAEPIAKVRNFDFIGHVYDLQSEMLGLYSSNGIIVKNCDCWAEPVFPQVNQLIARGLKIDEPLPS